MNKDTFKELRKVIAEKLTLGGRYQEGQPDLLVHNDAEIRNNLLVHKNLSILGDVQTEGSFQLNNVGISGGLSVGGITKLTNVIMATQVENTIVIKDHLSVGSSATIASCNNEQPSNYLEFTKTKHETEDNAHEIVDDGDDLGAILFKGSDGTSWVESTKIYSEVDGPTSTDDIPGKLIIATTPAGSSSSIDRLTILSSGNIGVNISNPPNSFYIDSSDALRIPSGNDILIGETVDSVIGEKPAEGIDGYMRYNTTRLEFEGYGNNTWKSFNSVGNVLGSVRSESVV